MIKVKQSKKSTESHIVKLKHEINLMTDKNCKVNEDDRNKSPPSVRPKWSNKPKTCEKCLAFDYGDFFEDPYIFCQNPYRMT